MRPWPECLRASPVPGYQQAAVSCDKSLRTCGGVLRGQLKSIVIWSAHLHKKTFKSLKCREVNIKFTVSSSYICAI